MRPEWEPTVAQVAARITARTMLANSTLAGTFTDETVPTASQVEAIIKEAVNLMALRLGVVAPRMVEHACALAALRAAYMTELAFFPEQSELSMSPYATLRSEYKEELENWDKAAMGDEPNDHTRSASLPIGTLYPGYATGTY